MGQSTNGVLAYGYDLGGGDGDWKIEEVGEYGEWEPEWLEVDEDEDSEDLITQAGERLMASVGFTETDWHADGFFDREKAAKARLGVEFESYCSGDYPMWLLAAHKITVYRGDCEPIDFAELEKLRAEGDWDTKFAHAVQVLGITPKQAKPGWLLVSYWG